LAISYILLMVFFLYTGFSLWMSFVLPLSGIITWFVMSQLWGRIGFMTEPCYNFMPGVIKMFVWPTVVRPEVTSTDIALAPHMSREWIGHQSITGWGGSLYTILASYRMAQLTNVNPRNVLKVMVATIFISMFITEVVAIAVTGVYGGGRFPSPIYKIVALESDGGAGNFWPWPSSLPLVEVAPHLIIGFVFMVVMRYLCTRFLWLPDPVVAIVAWDWVISLHGVWFACLAAWVVKYFVLRVGGSKLYESTVVPLVGGFMLGDALEVLLAALTAYGLLRVA